METKTIMNKENKPYVDKEGNELIENTFSEGDTFVPLFDRPLKKKADEENNRKYDEMSIKCKVMDSEGNKYGEEDNKGIFVKLTPTQYNKLMKLADQEELTQNKYVVYAYENKYGKNLGIGKKGSEKKPINLDE